MGSSSAFFMAGLDSNNVCARVFLFLCATAQLQILLDYHALSYHE